MEIQRTVYEHGERGGEGEVYGESNMENHITLCKIDSQWEFAVCLRKQTGALGWDGTGDGWEVQKGGDLCTSVTDSC